MKSIILAGGSGTRLWPLSRELYPKQFLKFSDTSLFQDTILRCLKISDPSDIYIVTTEKQKFFVYGQIEELTIPIPHENVVLEPEAKNTLPAIALAVCHIDPSSIVAVFPSDHILDINAMDVIKQSTSLVNSHLITFGIIPESPHTGYGYIKPGDALNGGNEALDFKEKPDPATALRYLEDGYVWNSGIFLFNIKLFESELKLHESHMWNEFFNSDHSKKEIFHNVKSISIDYGLIEKSHRVAVVKLDNAWSDLGDFNAMYNEFDKDKLDNVVYNCDNASINSKRNLIFSSKDKVVSLIDMNDMIVIDTKDALLICPHSSTQKVKDVVSDLKEQDDDRAYIHQVVYRPWGTYTVFETAEKHKIKNIRVLPGKSLSLQLHNHRSEHWVLVKGTAVVEIDGIRKYLTEGESAYISDNTKHRLHNLGSEVLEIIEVQFGDSVNEDDIVRFDDEYGRF